MFKFPWRRRAAAQAVTLIVNNAPVAAERCRVNLTVAVNSASIRTEQYNGREHLVLPSYTLPDDVIMNGGLYPHNEIEASYKGLEGTFAPLAHPQLDGTYIPAGTPEAINAHHIGAFNRNVRREKNRIYVEKWVDTEYARNTEGGKRLLEAVAEGKPIHTSTGIFMNRDLQANGEGYQWTARNMLMDHDAILLDEVGAATPEQGVGLLVNSRVEEAVPLKANASLSNDSYRARNRLLEDAARLKWPNEDFVWVEDFDLSTAVLHMESGAKSVSYTLENGKVTFADDVTEVVQKTTWIDKTPTVNRILQLLGIGVNLQPTPTQPPQGDLEMTPEELKAALEANNKTTLDAVKELLAPLSASVGELKTNQDKLALSLNAATLAAETEKRTAVAEIIGQEAADALTGNSLDAAYAKLKGAAPIVNRFTGTGSDADQPLNCKLPE